MQQFPSKTTQVTFGSGATQTVSTDPIRVFSVLISNSSGSTVTLTFTDVSTIFKIRLQTGNTYQLINEFVLSAGLSITSSSASADVSVTVFHTQAGS